MRGRDIKRSGYDWADLWLINTHNGVKGKYPRIDIKDYPAIKAHLDSFGTKVTNRSDQGDTPYNLRNCAYMDDFNKPKIMWKIIGCNINFCFDEKQMICNNAVNIMVGNKDNLIQFCGLMNSKLFDWYLKATTEAEVQGGGIQLYVTTLEDTLLKLNFPSSFTDKVRQRIVNQSSDNELNNYIYELYNLNPDEIAFIENNVR